MGDLRTLLDGRDGPRHPPRDELDALGDRARRVLPGGVPDHEGEAQAPLLLDVPVEEEDELAAWSVG